MILDPNGMPILQPAIDNAETATFNTAFSAIGTAFTTFTGTRQIQTFSWANAAGRTGQTGMVDGDEGYQQDNKTTWRYSGSVWAKTLDTTLSTTTAGLWTSAVVSSLIVENGWASLDFKAVRSSGTIGIGAVETVAMLPSGARPPGIVSTAAATYGTSAPTIVLAQIASSGEVIIYNGPSVQNNAAVTVRFKVA